MHLYYLRNVNASIIAREYLLELVFLTNYFLDCLIRSHCKDSILSVLLTWYTWKVNVFKFEFVNWIAILLLPLSRLVLISVEPPHEDAAVPTSWDKVGVIIKPLDASNLSNVSFVVELWRAFSCVELIDADIVLISACEQMASIWEPNLSTALDWDFLERFQALLKYVHHSDFICESNDDMEARGMESQTKSFILEGLTDVKSLLLVVPDSHSLVDTASTYQVLLNADIHAMDGSWMEGED